MNTHALMIPRSAVMAMGVQQGLNGVIPYLAHLQENPSKLEELLRVAGIPVGDSIKGILFHGSNGRLETLKPFQSGCSSDSFVYAASDPRYALFLALIHLKSGGRGSVNWESGAPEFSINVGFVNGDSTLEKGYVYIVREDSFVDAGNGEYVSRESVDILCAIEVLVSDMTTPILIRYDEVKY